MEEDLQKNMIVWTAYPQGEITSKDNAPEFSAQSPESAQLYGWQYAIIDAKSCKMIQIYFREDILKYL